MGLIVSRRALVVTILVASTPYRPEASLADNTAVWTGSEVLVWGGGVTNAGFRYDPRRDVTVPMTTVNAPSGRGHHSAVWTGAEMIVWGGMIGGAQLATGGRYDPANDLWLPTSVSAGVPQERVWHGAVWTGSEMIVWGGLWYNQGLRTGGRYDPANDSWRPTAVDAATPAGNVRPATAWTGRFMVVWGADFAPRGGRYDPATDAWSGLTTVGEPWPRSYFTSVWSGTEILIWGGYLNRDDGGAYDPLLDRWRPIVGSAVVPGRTFPASVWSGAAMIVWGDENHLKPGGRYDPASGSWSPVSRANEPFTDGLALLVWDGLEMDVMSVAPVRRYDPVLDLWNDGPRVAPTAKFVAAPTVGQAPLTVDFQNLTAGNCLWSWSFGDGGSSTVRHPTHTYVAPGVYSVTLGVTGTYGSDTERRLHYIHVFLPPHAEDIVTGAGASAPNAPVLKVWDHQVPPQTTSAWLGFGQLGHGVNVAAGVTDVATVATILAGPGPDDRAAALVRGFAPTGQPVPGLSFYAFGTLRQGVHVAVGDIDGDGLEEMLAGAGPRAAFGPHVRGFNHDGLPVTAIQKVSFMAYPVGGFGVRVGAGSVDLEGAFDEIVTGPGPSQLGPDVRAFDYDGHRISLAAAFFAFPGGIRGAAVAAGDSDSDGVAEVFAARGPQSLASPEVRGWDLVSGPRLDWFIHPFFTTGGAECAAIDFDGDGTDELLAGTGWGDSAPSLVRVYGLPGGALLADIVAYPGQDHGTKVGAADLVP